MSPPRCHSGNADNGTPPFADTSLGVAPERRHHILEPRGAEAEPSLAPRGSARSAAYSGRRMLRRTLTFRFGAVLPFGDPDHYAAAAAAAGPAPSTPAGDRWVSVRVTRAPDSSASDRGDGVNRE